MPATQAALPDVPHGGYPAQSISKLTIRNFRNIVSLDIEIPPIGVVVIGQNGQGKTNLLEAIYYLVLFRSFRGVADRELVRFDEQGFFVAGTADGKRVTAGYEPAGGRKKVTVDGQVVHRLTEAVGHLAAVPFSPEDRQMVAGGPSGRRRYMDVVLALSDPEYLTALSNLRAARRQRNAALRMGNRKAAQAFDGPFARAAAVVVKHRRDWVAERTDRFSALCAQLGETAPCVMRYHGSPEDEGQLREALDLSIERDLRHGTTTVGPHRDDLRLLLKDRSVRRYGSAGQQRTAAISLRLLEAETLAERTGSTPLALYDDVFAELDERRQENMLRLIGETLPGQAIITAPRDSEVPPALLDRARWTMTGGRLEE
ncbi:MAG: DNA replication and repair protein RecF [Gemmatimonadota bacterium]|nr:DNA replication and repair protein RecF [Gemmatimonadota bacterium]